MLQPDKLKKLNENALKMAEAGKSKEEILAMKDAFISQFGTNEPEKKNPVGSSTSTTPKENTELAPKTGSSVSKSTQGFPETDINSPIPNYKKMKTDVGPTSREAILRKKLDGVKVTSQNMEEIDDATTELSNIIKSKTTNAVAIKKLEKLKKDPNFLQKYQSFKQKKEGIPQEDYNRAKEELKSEEDNFEWTDYLREGAKKVANIGIDLLNTPINTFTGRSVGDKEVGTRAFEIPYLEEKKPLEKNLKEADQYFLQLKKEAAAKKEAIPTFTKEQRLEKAKELFIEQKIKSYKDSREKDYFQEQDDVDGGEQQSKFNDFEKGIKATKLEREQVLLNKQDVQAITFKRLEKEIKNLQDEAEKNGTTPELVASFNEKRNQLIEVQKDGLETINEYVSNRKDIGNAEQNIDTFKRNYSLWSNLTGNIRTSAESLASGAFGALDYGANAIGLATGLESGGFFKEAAKELKDASERTASKIERPISVDNINSPSDFGDWLMNDAIAKQVPIFAIIATGGVGVGALGASSLGTKFEEMQGEVQRGEKKYSTTEMLLHPIGYGLAETASAAVDLMILRNAGRVLASATAPERRMMAQGAWQRAKSYAGELGKQSLKGGVYETIDEMGTQGVQNLIDGKPFTEGMKDAGAAGGAMGFLIPFMAVNYKHTIKPFTTDAKIQEESARFLAFQSQLDNPNLDLETKTIIKENLDKSKKKVEGLIQKAIGNVTSLSNAQFQEIVSLERTQANIKNQSQKIQFDDNLDNGIKKQLLNNLQDEFKANDQRRLDLLNQGANVLLEQLDPKEVFRLKDLAQRRLRQEQNPDGTKNLTLNDNDISKTAIQIYNEETKEQNLRNARDKELVEREKANVTEESRTPGGIEEKNGTFYVTDEKGVTKGFSTKEEAQAKLAEIQSKSDLKSGTYEYNGKIYKYDGKSLTDETGSNLYPLSFEEDSLLNQIKNKGKLINEAPQQTEAEKLAELNDFLNQLDPEEREETQTELDNSPTVRNAIDGSGTFTLNGEEGVLKIEGQQVVFETKNAINELGNVDEISNSKLLEYGIEPVQELNIEVSNDYSVTIDGKSYKNTNSNPADAIVVGKKGEYSVTLTNDKGQKRTIRGQKAEQIAYNYKLKELENGSEQQIDQATKDAEIAVNDETTAVSEENGNPQQSNKKRRTKKQRSLKQAKSPLAKSDAENQELERLIAEEEVDKKNKKEAEDAEFQKLVEQEEDVQLEKMIQEEELAKKDPLFKEFIGLRDAAKRNKKQEIRFQKLNDVFKNKGLFNDKTPDAKPKENPKNAIPKQGTEVVWNKDKNYRGTDSAETAIGEDVSWKKGGIFGEDAFILEFGDVEGQDATHQGTKRGDLTKTKIEKVYYAPDFWAEESMAKEELAKMKAKFPDAQFIEIEVFSPNNDNIIYGKNKATSKKDVVATSVEKKNSPWDIVNKEEALYREKQQKDKDKAVNDVELIKTGDKFTIDAYFKKSGYKEITNNEKDTRLKGKEGKFFRSNGSSITIKNTKADVALDTVINVANKKIKGLSNSRIEEIVKNFKNESVSKSNSPADGNVRPSVEPNAPQGENNDAQPAVDAKPSEGEVEITTKRVKSKTFANKESEYDVDFDGNGNIKEIRSAKDNRIIPKFVERISKTKIDKTTNQFKKTISINPNWSKIEASAKGELTKNQLDILAKEERRKKVSEALDNFTPTNEYEAALEALAQGRKVSRESLKKETGNKDNNWATDKFSKVKLPSIEKLSEQIAEQYPDLDQTEIRNALIDIITSNKDIQQVQDRVIENYGENIKHLQEQELNAFLGSLSEKDLAMYEAIQAEDSYIEELSDKEAYEYFNEKTNEYEQGQQEYAKSETAKQRPENITPSNERQEGSGNQNGNPEGEENGGGVNNSGELANEVNRTKSLVAERVAYERVTPKNTPKKLPEIIKSVATALKTTLIYGKSKRGGAGSYNPSNTLVRISRAGDIDTVAHELGHLLDDRHDILGTIPSGTELAILGQLKWYSERGGSNPPAKYNAAQKAEYLQREGLAEFIRSYVANPSQTKILAPELLAHFKNVVDQKTQAILKDFSQDFLDFANATNIEKTLANVEDLKLPNKNKFIEWLKGFRSKDSTLSFTNMDKFYSEMANSNHFGIKAFKALLDMSGKSDVKSHENFEIMSRVFLGINGKLENIFATGLINAKNEKLKAEGGTFKKDANGRTVYEDGTPMTAKWLIEGLDTTSEEALTKEMNLVIAMGVAERTIEYAKKLGRVTDLTGIGGSVDTDLSVAIGALNEFEDLKNSVPVKYNRIKEGVERYRKMADAPLRYAVDKGRISEEQYKLIKDSNEYYIALNRNIELVPGEDLFVAFGGSSNAIGSAKDIIKKSKGGTETIENPYLSLLANINNIIKESDRNEVMSSFVEPLLNMRAMGDGTPIDFSKIGRLANDGDKNTISVYRKGKLEKWQFEENIYKGLKNIESISSDPILSVFAKPSQLIRWTVTHNPVFYARNIVKDTQARMIISNDHSSLKDMIHNASDRELFELYGGSQAGHLHTGKDSYSKAMVTAAKEITAKGGMIINPMNWGKKYVKFLQSGENINRIAEFNNSYKVAIKQGMSEYDAGLYAAFQARDLMDFAVAGHTMRKINQIVVFSNAGVQSIRKANKSLQRDPFGFAYRTALYSVLPTVAFMALRHVNDDEEEYEELPDQQRDLFFNFKTPLTGDAWISIPKPYELGLTSALVDRGISKIKGNDAALDGFMGTTIKTIMPFDESSFLGGLKPIVETAMNRNTYTGAAIVPEYESGKLLELRKGKSKASLVGQDVSLLFKQANLSVDPRNIDHIMKGYGTYFASQGMAITDLGKKEKTPLNFWIKQSGFAKDVASYNSKSVKKASDLAVEIGKINTNEMKSLRNKIEEFALETDIKKRKALTNVIYADAKKIVKEYSVEKENAILHREKQIELETNLDAVIKKIPARELRDNPEYIKAKKELKDYNESIKKPSN